MNSISMNFNFLAFMLYFLFSKTDVCNIQNRKNRTRIRKLRNWEIITNLDFLHLPLSWRRSLPYRNQSIDLQSRSMDWFLYDRDLRHEKVKDTHKENAPSNKTPVLTKSVNIDIWVVGTSNQVFIRGFHIERKNQKSKVVTGKTLFFVIGLFCTLHSICHNICFWQGSFVWKYCVFNLKNGTPVFWKRFSFFRTFVSKLKHWKRSKFSLIVT